MPDGRRPGSHRLSGRGPRKRRLEAHERRRGGGTAIGTDAAEPPTRKPHGRGLGGRTGVGKTLWGCRAGAARIISMGAKQSSARKEHGRRRGERTIVGAEAARGSHFFLFTDVFDLATILGIPSMAPLQSALV
eukprot:CAMPEP_0184080186 /NCGR_PEP_ID=MMETSP0974-20121125/2071_1 /TAXON_ID=483370 /ORGANISM="non described non described, Strain CCMP2097" /LENGTH=132 /DNA_ID=CAMNT_0026382843 /DNA_START=275 /DNA_END=673 /DNA_ORIENTATION=-